MLWARVLISVLPTSLHPEERAVELDIEICKPSDPEDAVQAWSFELHTEGAMPEGGEGPAKKNCAGFDRQKAYYHEISFREAALLTHVKTRCGTFSGEQFRKAVRMPQILPILPGDRAAVQINVYQAPGTNPVPEPTIKVFEEPLPQQLSGIRRNPSRQLSGIRQNPQQAPGLTPGFLGQVRLRRP